MKMSSTQETLFSLELLIDYVRFDGSRDVLAPAVGVRFLDFPTLLIYRSEQEDPSSKAGSADLCVSPEALSQPDHGDNLRYSFHKGKSCLFKMNLNWLHAHLMNSPLYAMVLDVKEEIPKLIGSCLISLAKVMGRIKADVDKHGIGCPTAHGERLAMPICNLMGNSIGSISLVYKIVSLGANLIPHIPDNRVFELGLTRGKGDQHKFKGESVAYTEKDEMPENQPGEISRDGEPADVLISAFTQTEQSVSRAEDAQENTAFCPPPLFYSSSLKNQQERRSFTGFHAELESLNIEDPEDGNNDVKHDFPEITSAKADRSSELTSTPRSQHKESVSAPLGNVIRQLPLLNALLVELTQLTNGEMTQQQQPLPIHPNLVWLYTSAQHPSAPSGPNTEHQKTINASPKPRPDQCKIKSSAAKKNEEKLHPKRTLKYGLTNAFLLRLKLVKPGLTKRHECIQYQKIQPMRPASSDHKRACKSGVNLDETVSSSEINPTASSKSQTKPSANEGLAKHVASFTETTFTERDPKVGVHIPSAVSPCSERSEQHDVRPNSALNDPGVQSFIENSRDESRASIRLHRSSSSEQDEYQDDFTSLNTTDGYSPDPLSSPEPNGRKTNSASSSSGQNKALPVPVKAENSPQRSLKGTRLIRPRLQTSALSLSSDDSEDGFVSSGSCGRRRPGSQSSGQKSPSVRRACGRAESFDSDPSDKGMTFSRVSKDSDLPVSDAEEERDKLGSLGLDRNCHHISELVFNKLPGYTL